MANWFVFRVLVLAGIVLLVGYWLSKHAPFGGPVVTLATSVIGMATAILGLVSQAENEKLKAFVDSRFADGVRWVLGPLPLTIGSVLVIALGFTCSTVTVRAESVGAPLEVVVDGEDTKTLDAGTTSVSFFRFTTPFGRPVKVKVDGRLQQTIDVAPWSGAVVQVEDLPPSPTLLLRVPEIRHESIENGTFEVTVRGKTYRIRTQGRVGALLLGPPRAVPREAREMWLLELESQNVGAVREAAAVMAWLEQASTVEIAEVDPNERIRVVFKNTSDTAIASLSLVVGDEPFQDLMMEKTTP